MTEAKKAIVFALHDSVMLLAPPGWTGVELRFEGRRLVELATRGEGRREPLPRPELAVDSELEARRLSEGVAELAAVLGRGGRPWVPGMVEVVRGDGFADWRLRDDSGEVAWFTRLEREELEHLLITDQLFAAVRGTERAFRELQGRFEPRVSGATRWHFDGQRLTIERGGPIEFPCELVGRYLGGSFRWCWGWGEPSARPQAVERVRAVCAPQARAPGMSAFWRESYECDEGFAWALAGHVAVAVGARGLYRGELPDGSAAVFAVLTPPAAN